MIAIILINLLHILIDLGLYFWGYFNGSKKMLEFYEKKICSGEYFCEHEKEDLDSEDKKYINTTEGHVTNNFSHTSPEWTEDQIRESKHYFWKDRNPSTCFRCGKTEEELEKLYAKKQREEFYGKSEKEDLQKMGTAMEVRNYAKKQREFGRKG